MISHKLPSAYYLSADVVGMARDLLGKVLCVNTGNVLVSGIISETEAYAGVTDRASHAYGGRHTARTDVMYRSGGLAYIYLCYGIHSLFNVVTGPDGIPHAVLIRSVIPYEGLEMMSERIGNKEVLCRHTDGPGKLTKALGLHFRMTGMQLAGDIIWLEDRDITPEPEDISVTARIGVDYAAEDAGLPYRFVWKPSGQISFSG